MASLQMPVRVTVARIYDYLCSLRRNPPTHTHESLEETGTQLLQSYLICMVLMFHQVCVVLMPHQDIRFTSCRLQPLTLMRQPSAMLAIQKLG